MSDTPRTTTQLQAIFPDNTTGLISAQDVRDLVVSAVNNQDSSTIMTGTLAIDALSVSNSSNSTAPLAIFSPVSQSANLIDAKVNSISKFAVTPTGQVSSDSLDIGAGNLTVDNSGNVVTFGEISANDFVGDGSNLTGVAQLATNSAFTAQYYFSIATLVDGANISWNLNTQQSAKVTIFGDRILSNPTNMKAGAIYNLMVIQGVGGPWTLGFGSSYVWMGGSSPSLQAHVGDTDILRFVSDGTKMYGGFSQLPFSLENGQNLALSVGLAVVIGVDNNGDTTIGGGDLLVKNASASGDVACASNLLAGGTITSNGSGFVSSSGSIQVGGILSTDNNAIFSSGAGVLTATSFTGLINTGGQTGIVYSSNGVTQQYDTSATLDGSGGLDVVNLTIGSNTGTLYASSGTVNFNTDGALQYTVGTGGDWQGSAPQDIKTALDRLAAAVAGLLGNPIP